MPFSIICNMLAFHTATLCLKTVMSLTCVSLSHKGSKNKGKSYFTNPSLFSHQPAWSLTFIPNGHSWLLSLDIIKITRWVF